MAQIETNGATKGVSQKVTSPSSLAHVVFRTSNYDNMVDFWQMFLGADVTYKNESIAFLRYDFEHHRIAIIKVPGTGPQVPKTAGMEHVAFTFDSLDTLARAYQQRKALGITPFWSINHGPTTSIYYKDPDGNSIETQVDNFDTVDEANAFMTSPYFDQNPIGTDFDPEDLVKSLAAGKDHMEIKKRVEIGVRGVPDFM